MEFLSAPPEVEGGITHSEKYHISSTMKIFTNGYQADLREMFTENKKIYWRVRALGLRKKPIGEFSNAELIYIDKNLTPPNCPLINNFDAIDYKPLPIYPAYSWIPIHDAPQYEVELLNHPPKVENDIEPSSDSLWRQKTADQSSLYDEYARPYAGPYYWRVRALDAENNPIGTWSDSEKFVVEDFTKGVNAAILGDSVAHGGGAVSYSPRALEYAYSTYLDFSILNLSRSGDTSYTSLQRVYSDILPFHPKNLIISTGTNCLRDASITAESVIEDFKAIEKFCVVNDIRPIFLTIMPINPENIYYIFRTETDENWHEKLIAINTFLRSRKFCIDIEPYFYDEEGEMSTDFAIDGMHPDLRGKMLMAEIINLNRHLFKN
jgi:lysophospholipase L1-like esterase